MKKLGLTILTVLVMMLSLVSNVGALEIPESVDEYFFDDANVLSEEVEYEITSKNYDMDRHCGAYIEVVTLDYINSDILDFSYQMFNEWGIGSASKENGVLLLVVVQEEKYYVMLGRGLESYISSARIDEILSVYFEPYFDDEQYELAISNTFDALFEELINIYGAPSAYNEPYKDSFASGLYILLDFLVFFIMIVVIVLVIVAIYSSIRYPRPYVRHRYRDPMYRTRPYHSVSRPVHSASRSSFRSTRSSSSSSRPTRSSGGSRSRGGSSRGFGGGRR